MIPNPVPPGRSDPTDELCEDIGVAIREFLERNPGTTHRRIRKAMHRAERSTAGGWDRRLAAVLAALTAFVAGIALGLTLA